MTDDGRFYHLGATRQIGRRGERPRWQAASRQRRRKTSDRHLIYAQSRRDYLLMTILDEPTAHTVAQMRTPKHRQAMQAFCDIADNFVYFGDFP